MERDNDVIELGTASVETKGGLGLVIDFKSGQQQPGITED